MSVHSDLQMTTKLFTVLVRSLVLIAGKANHFNLIGVGLINYYTRQAILRRR